MLTMIKMCVDLEMYEKKAIFRNLSVNLKKKIII